MLHRKAEAQGARPSKPEKKGTRLIGNSRGIAAQVRRLLSGSGKALDTFLCLLHESGLVERREDVDESIEVVLDEEGQRWVS